MITKGVPTCSDAQFTEALAAYRHRWPQDGYFDTRQRYVETFKLLRRFYTGGQLLDVGGWPGDFACTLALLQLPVTVLDKDLTRQTMKIRDEATGCYFLGGTTTLADKCRFYGLPMLACDLEREPIPLAEKSVEFIVFTEVIEHLRVGLLHALRELYRVLAPGGCLLLTTPNLLSLRNRLSLLVGRTDYDTMELPYDALAAEERFGHGGHFRVFSLPEVVDLMQRTGFRIRSRGYRQILPLSGEAEAWSLSSARRRVLHKLAQWLRPLGNTVFLVCTREG